MVLTTLTRLAELAATLVDPIDPTKNELGWLGGAPWAKVALVVTAAVFVLTVGTSMTRRRSGRRGARRPKFDLDVAKMDSLQRTRVADALEGPLHVVGVLASASGNLGGPPGAERVWHNRAGGDRSQAVAAELVLVRDESGQVAIDRLDLARVIAAIDRAPSSRPKAHDTASLYLGDRVQVLGYFRSEKHGDDDDPRDRVYGVIGAKGHVQIRVLERHSSGDSTPSSEPATS